MREEQVIGILRRNQLSVTASRRRILEMFLQSGSAMAHNDVERQSSGKFDRVTVYRTLQTFLDKGIIHTIPTTDNSVLYALCKDECEEGHHHDNHVHFVCDACGTTTCMDELVIPTVKLPSGYRSSSIHMVVNGTCKTCSG